MADPVVRFGVIGVDPDRLRRYYGELFGWTFATPSPVARKVSDPDSYGVVDLRPETYRVGCHRKQDQDWQESGSESLRGCHRAMGAVRTGMDAAGLAHGFGQSLNGQLAR